MSNVLHSRSFRLLVCLILVASFLVNLSPLKADATAVVGTLLTFEGLMAALFSMSIGVVAVDLTVDAWNKIGEDLGQEIEKAEPSVVEAWVDVEAMYEAYGPDGPDDPEDALEWAEKLKHVLSRGLLAAIAGWLCSLVKMGGYEVEGDPVSDGYAIFGSHLLLDIKDYDSAAYHYVLRYINSTYLTYRLDTSKGYFTIDASNQLTASDKFRYGYYLKSSGWDFSGSTMSGFSLNEIVWTNHDILYSNGSLAFSGSQPFRAQTEIIEPSIYVGDIPDQIQNGDKDENNLDLPIIDPFRVIQSPSTALNDINQIQHQLMNGTTTLDDYLQQVQLQEPTQPDNPSTDPSSPTSPSVDPDPWEPPEDPGKFALDLSKVFPFCIPFDLYAFLTCLNADPVTPVINWDIAMPGGGSYPLTVDLSPFDSVAQLLRRLELLLFCVGLAMKTRDLIKG